MRCTSILGHTWVDLKDSHPWYEYTWKRVCKKCGLVQKMRECVGVTAYVYVDVGYAENVDELIALALEQKAESRREATHKKQVKERNIRETIIPTRELVLKVTNKEVDSQ